MSGLARFERVADVVVQDVRIAQRRFDPAVLEGFLGGCERAGGAHDARAARVAQIMDAQIVDAGIGLRLFEGLAQGRRGQGIALAGAAVPPTFLADIGEDEGLAFIVVGLSGLLVAPLLRLTVKDPKRGGTDAVKTEAQVAALAAAPVGTDRAGKIAAQIMLGLGAGLLVLGGLDWLLGLSLGNPLVLAFGGLLAGVIGASLMVARRTASVVIKKPSFWLLALGAASSSVCGYGVAGWLPLFFMRSFDLSLRQTSWYYSGIALIGGLLGIWLGGMIADKLSKKGKGAYPLTPAVAFLISAPCFILAMNSPWLIGLVLPGGGSHAQQLILAFLIFLLPTGLNLAWLGPITAAVQHLVPAAMRSTASALFLLINNLLGIAVGFYYFGWMSDLLAPRFGEESLRWAIYTGMSFYVLAAILLFGASRTLKRDWVD